MTGIRTSRRKLSRPDYNDKDSSLKNFLEKAVKSGNKKLEPYIGKENASTAGVGKKNKQTLKSGIGSKNLKKRTELDNITEVDERSDDDVDANSINTTKTKSREADKTNKSKIDNTKKAKATAQVKRSASKTIVITQQDFDSQDETEEGEQFVKPQVKRAKSTATSELFRNQNYQNSSSGSGSSSTNESMSYATLKAKYENLLKVRFTDSEMLANELKKKVEESKNMHDYIINTLKERNGDLESKFNQHQKQFEVISKVINKNAVKLKKEVQNCKEKKWQLDRLNEDSADLSDKIETMLELVRSNDGKQAKKDEELYTMQMEKKHNKVLKELQQEHDVELKALKKELKQDFDAQISEIIKENDEEYAKLLDDYKALEERNAKSSIKETDDNSKLVKMYTELYGAELTIQDDPNTFMCRVDNQNLQCVFKLILHQDRDEVEYIPISIADNLPEFLKEDLFFYADQLCSFFTSLLTPLPSVTNESTRLL